MTERERFWAKVDFSGECWVWTGTRAGGYGRFYLNRRMMPAHRYSWTETSGPIPDGLMVLHKCDNPSCVRPDHLFLGTQSDNMLDASAKNRIYRATRTVTHCLRGHELVGDNMRIRPDGAKVCRVCEVERRGTKLHENTVLDCGDNSCLFATRRGGMRTNGGCRCIERLLDAAVARERERIIELVELKRAKFNIGTRARLALSDVLEQIRARGGARCEKVAHDNPSGGYLHGENDDGPYDVDGVSYCGR